MLNIRRHRILSPCIVLAVFVAGGCVNVPVRMQPRIQAPEGMEKAPDPSAIQSGITTRDTILKDWGWSDVQVECDRLFVGEMKRATKKWVETVAGIPTGSCACWETQFLFVEFDEKGVVTKSYFVPRNRMDNAMIAFLESTTIRPLDLSKQREVGGKFDFRGHLGGHDFQAGTLLLGDSGFDYLRLPESAKPRRVRIEIANIKKFGSWMGFDTVELQGMPRGQNRFEVDLKPADVFLVLHYLQQVAPGSLPQIKAEGVSQTKK